MERFNLADHIRRLSPEEMPKKPTPEEQEESRKRLEELRKSMPDTWSTERPTKVTTKRRDNGQWMLKRK